MLLLLLLAMGLGMVAAPVSAQSGGVTRFATLPTSEQGLPGHPEGMAADPAGNIYVASFELAGPLQGPTLPTGSPFPARIKGPGGEPSEPFQQNYIYVFDPNGRLTTSVPLPAFPPPLPARIPLGMVVKDGALYVNDVMYGDVLKYSLPLSASSTPTVYNLDSDICGGFIAAFGVPGTFCALNDITFRPGPGGILAMSDNAAVVPEFGVEQRNGRILWLDPASDPNDPQHGVFFDPEPGNVPVNTDEALDVKVGGFPGFGVNGIQFTPDGSKLIMVNMSSDEIWEVEVGSSGVRPNTLKRIFLDSSVIDGPDDIVFDNDGLLWVTSGQNHQVVALDLKRQPVDDVARRGSFQDFFPDGAPRNLLQPSSIVFSRGFLFVTNEANGSLLPQDFYKTEVEPYLATFTVSRFNP